MQTVTLPARYSKVGTHTKAECSGFERLDLCRVDARLELSEAISLQLRHSFTRHYRWASDGTAFVLYYSDGWAYDIVGDSQRLQGCASTCQFGGDEKIHYHLALEAMQRHVDDYGPAPGQEGDAV